jgi:hypothetical protein
LQQYGVEYVDRTVSMHEAAERAVAKMVASGASRPDAMSGN